MRGHKKRQAASSRISPTTPIEHLPDLCRVPDAARKLDVSAGVVRDMARRGQLESVKLGRLVRIRRTSIAALLHGNHD
jgi:excisionase family DNA binding protein